MSPTTSGFDHWQLKIDDKNVLWLCIDKGDSSANVLSGEVLSELSEILQPLVTNPPAGVILHSGKANGFVMGADINEFTRIEKADDAFDLARRAQMVLDQLAALTCSTVAVINGFALGGGLELALACKYRLGLQHAAPVIGFPEVQLGIQPGFGGTIRAVQTSGVRAAMELMLTGKSITMSKARRIGIVDAICSGNTGGTGDDWRSEALVLLNSGRPRSKAPLIDRILNLPPIRPLLARMLRKQVSSKVRQEHYPAPYAIIEMWEKYGATGEKAYVAEARSIADLMVTPTSRNLVRVFFLQNKLKSQGNKAAAKISRVHVIGAGVMGGDIAAWCALRGLTVTLQDRADEYVQPALSRASKLFDRKTYTEDDRKAAHERLAGDVAGDGISQADLIIEAIFENRDAKQALYQDVQKKMKPGAILATNTSSIRLEELRSALDHPARFIGLHFFNPVAQMPLLELVRCADTEQDVLDIAFGFIKKIGKYGLECNSAPGFVVNRLLAPYMSEAMHLAREGVPLSAIDAAAENFGMPMGPVELVDTVGIDVASNVSNVLGAAFGRPVPDELQKMVDAKTLGRKTGQGFYQWRDGKAIKPSAGNAAIPSDIEDRLILPLVNEAIACLSEGVVADPELLDAGVIFGTGFAPFRGGPLQYARDRGVEEVRNKLAALAAAHGDRYRAHDGWLTFS